MFVSVLPLWLLAFLFVARAQGVVNDDGCQVLRGSYGATTNIDDDDDAVTFGLQYQLEWYSRQSSATPTATGLPDYHATVWQELTEQVATSLVKRLVLACESTRQQEQQEYAPHVQALRVDLQPTTSNLATTETISCGDTCAVFPGRIVVVAVDNTNKQGVSLQEAMIAALTANSPLLVHGENENGLQILTWTFKALEMETTTLRDDKKEALDNHLVQNDSSSSTEEVTTKQDETKTNDLALALLAACFSIVVALYWKRRASLHYSRRFYSSHHYNSHLSLQQLLSQLPCGRGGGGGGGRSRYKRVSSDIDVDEDITEFSSDDSFDDGTEHAEMTLRVVT